MELIKHRTEQQVNPPKTRRHNHDEEPQKQRQHQRLVPGRIPHRRHRRRANLRPNLQQAGGPSEEQPAGCRRVRERMRHPGPRAHHRRGTGKNGTITETKVQQ